MRFRDGSPIRTRSLSHRQSSHNGQLPQLPRLLKTEQTLAVLPVSPLSWMSSTYRTREKALSPQLCMDIRNFGKIRSPLRAWAAQFNVPVAANGTSHAEVPHPRPLIGSARCVRTSSFVRRRSFRQWSCIRNSTVQLQDGRRSEPPQSVCG